MKIALIGDSSILFMPYIENYLKILKKININYTVINWDRLQLRDNQQGFEFRDTKTNHSRNLYEYYLYIRFIKQHFKKNKYDRIIIFGIPTSLLLKKFLLNKFRNNYVIDIRDHHKLLRLFSIERLIKESKFSVISSPEYKEWLPSNEKIVVNHNTNIDSPNDLFDISLIQPYKNIVISNIGTIIDYKANINLVDSLKSSKKINVHFYGDGIENENIKRYVNESRIKNVLFSGRYKKDEEVKLYQNSTFINIMISNDGINNKTCMANRFYNGLKYGKILLTNEGTYLAKQVKKYKVGLVLDTFYNLEELLLNYLNNFDYEAYLNGRKEFFTTVIKQNNEFEQQLVEFAN